MTHVMLVGNPNCGKTTLFNALTGEHQRVGNWPGVTVEKKTGVFAVGETSIELTDLPGVYSLVSSIDASPDEDITSQAVAFGDVDIFINVIDACHLERHLYLTSQLLELGKPVVVVLNMMDMALQRGIHIETSALSQQLKCPVVTLQAHRKVGLDALKHVLASEIRAVMPLPLSYSKSIQQTLSEIEHVLVAHDTPPALSAYLARRVLEGDSRLVDVALLAEITLPLDADVLMADARYQIVHEVVLTTQKKTSDASEHVTATLDRVVLHRFWALPIFFSIMYGMFFFAIHIGGAFQDFFDISTDAIFVQGTAWLLQQAHAPTGLIALLAMGVGKGINTTLTFIPVLAAMYFFLALLETSGYMARAAFVVDKAMRLLGLPGKAFVPMIVGFGCNVPAIMAARTLNSEQDRLLTVLMSPFMSCSARLAIYAVFVAAFFPEGGQNLVFSLYMIGILMAISTGYLLRKTVFRGQASPLILELPSYHRPSLRRLLKETSLRLRYFIWRAGKMIIPVSILLGGLNALTLHGGMSMGDASGDSLLSMLGRYLTPLFSPMGLQEDNWPATVGLLSGMLAKEVVVGSLNTLYTQMGHWTPTSALDIQVWPALQMALWSIPQHLAGLGSGLLHPLANSQLEGEGSLLYGMMAAHFDGKVGAYAYLLFVLLYIPCVSTMAAIRQEAHRRWMYFSVMWSLLVAYSAAVLFYQIATIYQHPQQSLLWIMALMAVISLVVLLLYRGIMLPGGRHVTAAT